MNNFKSFLSEQLLADLPGKLAHQEAAPYRKVDYDTLDLNTVKKSGVLILFYNKGEETHLVLIQRPIYNGTHSGQIAFPGGKVEESDKDIIHTALREANEEVGVEMNDVEVLGQLSDVYIPVSNFLVTPVIGVINYTPRFIPELREVAEIIELRIGHLIEVETLRLNKIKLSNGLQMEVPTFEFNQKIIWGATALMLNELRYLLKGYSKSL
ncbi:CoA pyrophosphatase [Vicingus serpentipes]|jgi:8-oxo-dGTP pyrophosphatase MutT (NUDIX family)|uniref:CoA pyrophosphatase n=1 Tax=Vicingus serpentipes TaxID=1926625 RepID=A0A5C6RY49_9FLAO|nr:CoA pyrophosphatase [Vicingus serpentipes]TXB67308.1 CoA pyrophosphatase [Vicingus serpentipes]